ncbi:MAG: hypothetical protein NTY09_10495 [bacterium]|nr:hypothetical protein [bacterium]
MSIKYISRNSIIKIMAMLFVSGSLIAGTASGVRGAASPWPAENPNLGPGALTSDELYLIDSALKSINMTWDDMGFRKDYAEDPFRLEAAQRALDEPYFLVQWTYEWDAFLLDPKPVPDILYRAAIDLDCDVHNSAPLTPSLSSIGRPQEFPLLPASWAQTVSDLDMAVKLAQDRMGQILSLSLTEDDRNYLPWYLICHFQEDASEDCPEEDEYATPQQFLDAISHFDLDSLVGTSRELASQVDTTVAALSASRSDANFAQPFAVQGKSGTILIGSMGDDVWYMDEWQTPSIIIDPGGNDIYYGQVAVAGNLKDEQNGLVSIAIDLAGNDMYLSDGARSCGSGVLGIAELVDVSGDDVYRSGDFSQGSGLFGAGIFQDMDGNDIYDAGTLVQGAGAIGVGLLIDSTGNDSYRAALYAQGMGYTRGWGMLSDRNGFDSYWAGGVVDDFGRYNESNLSLSQGFGMGMRPLASGGIGILNDRNGNDFYSTEVYGQGVSYWFSIGALIDDNGHDWYESQQYSQGSGIHLSSGILLDRGGMDRYSSQACTQGFGHDYAVGWLIDEGGDDYYTGDSLAQGSGNANAVGILIDRGGHDGYFGRSPVNCGGHGNPSRDFGSIGVLIDMGGADTYSDPISGDGKWWTKTTWGVGIDVGDDWWDIVLDEEGDEVSRTLKIPGME